MIIFVVVVFELFYHKTKFKKTLKLAQSCLQTNLPATFFAEINLQVSSQIIWVTFMKKLLQKYSKYIDSIPYFPYSYLNLFGIFVCTFSGKERCYFSYVKYPDLEGYNKSSIKIEDLEDISKIKNYSKFIQS